MIKEKRYESIRLGLLVAIGLLIPLFIVKQLYFTEVKGVLSAEYVGGTTCIACHEAEYNDWLGSHHDLAMDYANDSTVLGNFNDVVLKRGDQEHRFFKRGDEFWVLTDGEDGTMKEYQVKYVFGFTPLQNYLVEFPGGRLQTLALTWSTTDSSWFYMPDKVYANEEVDHNNWLHWTNQAQNWNSMCAYCHSTKFVKGYDVDSDSYQTTWSEIDVSCEACHGPASAHLEWADAPDYAREDVENYGLVVKTSGIDNEEFVNLCIRCHSRRSNFSDFDPHWNNIYDHLSPELPIPSHYHIDGQIKAEDYVYGSFTQSKMYMNGVQCNDCHNVHSGRLVMEGNDLCLQCHKAADYDTYEHHFHQTKGGSGEAVVSAYGDRYEVGSGAECINCHMPAQYYMGVDLRNDHSFRIPRPDLSDKLASPNACTQCHGDKNNAWAQKEIEKRHGKSKRAQFGVVFHDALEGKVDSDSMLWSIIDDEVYPVNVRCAAMTYLNMRVVDNRTRLLSYLSHHEAAMRVHSLRIIDIHTEAEVLQVLHLLNDQVKLVRMEAALKLSNIPRDTWSASQLSTFSSALDEYMHVQEYNADFPMGKFALGNYYMAKQEYDQAERFFLAALAQDSELDIVQLQLAYLYNNMERQEDAVVAFKNYLAKDASNATVCYDLGLLLSELANKEFTTQSQRLAQEGRRLGQAQMEGLYADALLYLEKSEELMPQHSRAAYNIAMIYQFLNNRERAEFYLQKYVQLAEGNPEPYITLLNFYIQIKDKEKAESLAQKMVGKFPQHAEIQKLKGWKL